MYAASAITRFVVPVAADALGGKKVGIVSRPNLLS
jgi:hypothetical protein